MQQPNLRCSICGSEYYSASPETAAALSYCEDCGVKTLEVIREIDRGRNTAGSMASADER